MELLWLRTDLHQPPNAVFAQRRFGKRRDASISRSLSHQQKKEYIVDLSDFRRLRLHEAIFKGFDGESVIGPAKIYLKPYWKERSVSYFQEEGQ